MAKNMATGREANWWRERKEEGHEQRGGGGGGCRNRGSRNERERNVNVELDNSKYNPSQQTR